MHDTQNTPRSSQERKFLWSLRFVQLSKKLSFKSAWQLSGMLTPVLSLFNTQFKSTTLSNIKHACPELSTKEQESLSFESIRHTLCLALESGSVWIKPLEYGIEHIDNVYGMEHLKQYLAQDLQNNTDHPSAPKKGLLFLLPHLGNWEMANQFIAPKTHVVAMYKPHKNPYLDQLIQSARMRAGVTMVPTDRKGVSQVLRHLKAGGVSVILPDQVPEAGSGLWARFFGQPAYTGTLIPKLLQSTGAQALGLSCVRNLQGTFDVHITPAPDNIYHSELQIATQSMNFFIEDLVRPFIGQYQWSYKRFKEK